MILLGQQIDYIHDVAKGPNVSTSISCIKQPTIYSELEKFTTKTVQLMEIYNKTVGDYPYKQ
jgi:hypothetical protein